VTKSLAVERNCGVPELPPPTTPTDEEVPSVAQHATICNELNYTHHRARKSLQIHIDKLLLRGFQLHVQSLSIEMSQNAFLRDSSPIAFTTTSSKILFMSTIRTPLGPINGNITRGKELIPKLRNKICALAENGHDIPFIIGRYKVSRGVIRYTLDHQASCPETNTSAPRPSTKKHIIIWTSETYYATRARTRNKHIPS
jgi:hypothetical protein